MLDEMNRMKQLLDLAKKQSTSAEQKEIPIVKENSTMETTSSQVAIKRLDAVVDLGNGVLTTSDFYQQIRPDVDTYETIKLTPEEELKVRKSLSRQRTSIVGSSAMICSGDKCPFKNECPLAQIGKTPIGKQCPIELELLAQWTQQFMHEFGVEMDNFTELGLITELAECNLYERRTNLHMANTAPTMTILDVIGVDAKGNAIEGESISKSWEIKEKIKNRRDKILKSLMATRDAKVKLKAVQASQQQVSVLAHLAEMKEKMAKLSAKKD